MTRRRWTYTLGGKPLPEPLEVTSDFNSSAERTPLFTDRHHEGNRAPDGTDIGSAQRRREWMRATGVADFDDFKQTRAQAAAQREAFMSARTDTREVAETVGRAAYELSKKRRR